MNVVAVARWLAHITQTIFHPNITDILRVVGPVAAFIHLALEADTGVMDGQRALVKMIFLAAKHLKPSLTTAGLQGRSVFMTVTHLDGVFGLGQDSDFNPVTGGLFGLVKTLNLEWESVFCRAVDLHPALKAGQQVDCILAELYDPNRLVVEIGYTLTGRSTLALMPVPVTGAKK